MKKKIRPSVVARNRVVTQILAAGEMPSQPAFAAPLRRFAPSSPPSD
jgi:hypothetical protein